MSAVDPATVVLAAAAVAAAAVYFYYYSPQANQPDMHPLQLAQLASVGRVRESASESPVYRSKSAPEGTRLLATPAGGAQDLRGALRAGRRAQRSDALRTVAGSELRLVSSGELARRVQSFAGGLLRLLSAGRPGRAAVLALPGSVEATVALLACIEAGVVAIPVAASESPAAVARVIAHSGAAVLVTTPALAAALAPLLDAPALAHIIATDEPGGPDVTRPVRGAVALARFGDLEQGPGPDADAPVSPAAVAFVLYGPGASGSAQGVAVTHANAVAALAGLASALPPAAAITARDVFMAVGSLASATDLSLVCFALMCGCSLAVAETADAEVLVAQAALLQPTFTHLGPLVVRDLVQLFSASIQQYPWLERTLFGSGYRRAADSLMRGVLPKKNLWDMLYARHYRNALGGRLRLVFVDGRGTTSQALEWLRVLHGARVVPVFGPRHASGVAVAGSFYDYATAIDAHNVGAPLACNEIKLVDAPEAGLSVEDEPNPRGAVAVRGPNVATSQWSGSSPTPLPSDDGWLVLPYYGEILPNGALDIIGDRETVVKCALCPTGLLLVEGLEHALASSPAAVDVCVVALPAEQGLGILVYPQLLALAAAARQLKKEFRPQSIAGYPWCAEFVRDKLVAAALQAGFRWLAQVPPASLRVKLVAAPFTAANGLASSDGTYDRAAVLAALAGS
ncbi:medium-chain fatty acid-CoA ligase faa2 [Coemansia nantahalensis]|nr:medium-chain fatty acid-CoA ligase faa2 [Coemansia nantahalensis]